MAFLHTYMKLPLLSICIPAYKRPDCLFRLLNSLSNQTFKDFEIIITDDSSADDVIQVVESFNNLPIQYSRNVTALGSPANWNFAISKAKGEWIHLLHADDWYAETTSLQQFADVIMKEKSDFIFCASKEINQATNHIKDMMLTVEKKKLIDGNPINLVYDNVIGHPSTVIHKKDAGITYDTSFKWVVDIDFYIRYLQQHGRYIYIPEPLINIGMDTEQVSETSYKNPFVEIPEYLNLLNKFPENIAEENRYVFHCLWNLVRKFKIKEEEYIRQHGYTGKITAAIPAIIHYQKNIPRIVLKQTSWSAWLMNKYYTKYIKK